MNILGRHVHVNKIMKQTHLITVSELFFGKRQFELQTLKRRKIAWKIENKLITIF